MGLSSFKILWSAPKHASFLQQSAYRPFKVISKVVEFGTNRVVMAGIMAGRVHLCRVAGNTVLSHKVSDAP